MADGEGNDFANKMRELELLLRTNLASARADQEHFANQHRQPAPAYRVGDEVFLDRRNIASTRPIKKLDHKFYGPYRVAQVLGSHSYKLKLPFEQELLHPVFHTNLLKPAWNDPLPGQTNPPPPPVSIDADGSLLWAIDAILDSRRDDTEFYYLIQWRGYDAEDQSWEPLENVVNAQSSISTFALRFPKKLHPTKAEIARAKAANRKRSKKLAEENDEEPAHTPTLTPAPPPTILLPKSGPPVSRPNTRLQRRRQQQEEIRFVELDSDDEEIDLKD